MNNILAVFVLSLYAIASCQGFSLKKASIGQPWPMPSVYKSSNIVNTLNTDDFRFVVIGTDCSILRQAFVRYNFVIFRKRNKRYGNIVNKFSQGEILQLSVNVSSPCQEAWPNLESDESYFLSIRNGRANLVAKEIWGALWGLETFGQLIYRSSTSQYVVNDTIIDDRPRFAHRGLLLDTSRHFLSKTTILRNLDAMAQNKLNVFHWHIVDDQSFPFQSSSLPYLSEKGAYNPSTHIYTIYDIKEIIRFARLRGIRVVAEFDTPGHTRSWGYGQPGLLTRCYSGGNVTGDFGPIDPTRVENFNFLRQLFTEVAGLFPDYYLHLGGDEVPFGCWKSNPEIMEFMKSMSFGENYAKLEEYYMQKLLDIVKGLSKGYIVWQEVIDNDVKVQGDTVVEVWKNGWPQEMAKVTKLGYRVLLATPWYLNYISFGSDWIKYYTVDPLQFNGSDTQKALVMGGELCMWGEYVDNTNVFPQLWPRASAVSERLWSPSRVADPKEAEPRLIEHRCRMIRRGIPAEPVTGPNFCPVEYDGY